MESARPLDGYATSLAWQQSPTRIAVLPVGSCEQHGGRLPLLTDTILAEYFAARLAASLDAVQLPPLAYATSHEHTGYRGSFSLRPETAMAVIRDLLDNLEQQGFARVVVVNGHGGNFFLGPVLRDRNAQDRPLKALMVECSGRSGPTPEGGELHAGASEIARLMAIRPDLVGPVAAALPVNTQRGVAFQRGDLTTFGIGHRDASGVWGDGAGGDPADGHAQVERIAAAQLAHVRERLAWLAEQPAYAGMGGVAVRRMVEDDIADGMRLGALAGWNQTPDDWRLFLRLRPEGAFVAVRNGQVLGTATTLAFAGRLGWIGMVLVDPAIRRAGLGTMLMQSAMASLAAVPAIGLDATAAGKKVYDRLGFADRCPLHRLIRRAAPAPDLTMAGVRPMQTGDVAAAAALDAQALGHDRTALLAWLHERNPSLAWVATGGDGTVRGCLLGRPGVNFTQLGPLVAPDLVTAQALLGRALTALTGRTVGLDAGDHSAWLAWLASLGFVEERGFIRMVRGADPGLGRPELAWAIAGPELG